MMQVYICRRQSRESSGHLFVEQTADKSTENLAKSAGLVIQTRVMTSPESVGFFEESRVHKEHPSGRSNNSCADAPTYTQTDPQMDKPNTLSKETRVRAGSRKSTTPHKSTDNYGARVAAEKTSSLPLYFHQGTLADDTFLF
ncbi:hypothetical protein T265_13339, partial [Opisthorchis viverrini]